MGYDCNRCDHQIRHCIEKPDFAHYFIELHSRLLSANLEHLLELWGKNPDLKNTVIKLYDDLMKERREN